MLYAIDACCEKQLDGVTGFVVENGTEQLFRCCEIPQTRVKANRVLAALGLGDGASKGGRRSGGASSGGVGDDLLDFGGEDRPAGTSTDLLGDMDAGGGAPGDLDDLLGLGGGEVARPALSGGRRDVPSGQSGGSPVDDLLSEPRPAEGGLFGDLNVGIVGFFFVR